MQAQASVKNVRLPKSLKLANGQKFALNWNENGNLDGFVAHVSGLPVYKNSEIMPGTEILGMEIWDYNNLSADVAGDGTAKVYIKI